MLMSKVQRQRPRMTICERKAATAFFWIVHLHVLIGVLVLQPVGVVGVRPADDQHARKGSPHQAGDCSQMLALAMIRPTTP